MKHHANVLLRLSMRCILLMVIVFVLTGCHIRDYSPPGVTTIAVTSIVPLSQLQDDLSPKFQIDGEKAFKQAMPDTSFLTEQILRSVTAQASASIDDGTAPELGEVPSTSLTPRQASTDKLSNRDATTDPFLRYTTATALLQEVRMLNASVTSAAYQRGLIPYIVRIQINQQPYRRNVGHDTYVDLSFFAGDKDKYIDPKWPADAKSYFSNMGFYPEVVPLLVTDNIEGSAMSQTVQTLRALSIALGASAGSADLSGRLDAINERLGELQARQFNSLLTVGRLSGNTLRVRIGARALPDLEERGSAFGSSKAVQTHTVPQSHYVTAVVMVPAWRVVQGSQLNETRSMRLRSYTHYADPESGAQLGLKTPLDSVPFLRLLPKSSRYYPEAYFLHQPNRVQQAVLKQMQADIQHTLDSLESHGIIRPKPGCACNSDFYQQLAHRRLDDDPLEFMEKLDATIKVRQDWDSATVFEQVWLSTVPAMEYSPTQLIRLEVPPVWPEILNTQADKEQKIVAIDTGKQLTVTIPVAGKNLRASDLTAWLILTRIQVEDNNQTENKFRLPADKIEVLPNGVGVRTTFTSLHKLGKPVTDQLANGTLGVQMELAAAETRAAATLRESLQYFANKVATEKGEKEKYCELTKYKSSDTWGIQVYPLKHDGKSSNADASKNNAFLINHVASISGKANLPLTIATNPKADPKPTKTQLLLRISPQPLNIRAGKEDGNIVDIDVIKKGYPIDLSRNTTYYLDFSALTADVSSVKIDLFDRAGKVKQTATGAIRIEE